MIRALVGLLIAATSSTCGDSLTGPGQANFRASMTVLNRTEAVVTVQSGARTITVPPCGEATAYEVLVNGWELTSPGRDSFHGGGGFSGTHAYLVVTTSVSQVGVRPAILPPCDGLLQPR